MRVDEALRALHDEVAQELFVAHAALVQMAALDPGDPSGPALTATALASVRRGLRRTCDLVAGLRATITSDEDLPAALQRTLIEVAAPAGLAASYRETGDGAYPGSEAVAPITAIVREALVNAREHASASEVRVCVRRQARWTRISVSDNGLGLAVNGLPRDNGDTSPGHTGFGLAEIQQQARALGGRVGIRSRPGLGVTMTLDIPPGRESG